MKKMIRNDMTVSVIDDGIELTVYDRNYGEAIGKGGTGYEHYTELL